MFSLTVADFFHAPSVDEVDMSGYTGQAMETPAASGRWVYAATVAVGTGTTVRIEVTATDRPGGATQVEEEKAL